MNKNEAKKEEENKILNSFLKTKIGTNWYSANNIVEKIPSETPDFLFKTADNKILGIEIVDFYVEHSHLNYSRTLTRIGDKLRQETKKQYGIEISMIIDKFDPRKWSANWKDHLDAAYNPGFTKLPQENIFKQKSMNIISNNIEKIKQGQLVKEWIQINEDHYQISIECYRSPFTGKYDCHVNNTGEVKFNPFEELRLCINNKNQKIEKYKANCDKCYLLIAVQSNKIGNYCTFTDRMSEKVFPSDFEAVFLYDVDKNCSNILNT